MEKLVLKHLKKLSTKYPLLIPKKKNFNLINKSKTDAIFNALHGKDGEDGVAQSYFEYLKIPYTHSGVVSSFNAMDKLISKKIFLKNKIKTPKYFSIDRNHKISSVDKKLKLKKINYPVIVKPINEGSSLGVELCKNKKNLINSIKKLVKKYGRVMIEQYIPGQEIQVAIINGRPLGAIELIPKRQFYDYKAKYTKSAKTKHIMPARLSKLKYSEVLNIAKKTHDAFKCRGVTRADFKFYKGNFYLLEINTQPGMTSLSLVPEIANYKGINFEQLVEKILLDASINK